MRAYIKGLLVSVGLVAGLAVTSASAQNYTANMDYAQWQRLWSHFDRVQQQINFQVQSGALPPAQAWVLQRELGATEVSALFQRLNPNGANHDDIWGHLHHIHRVLGGDWDHEFDRY